MTCPFGTMDWYCCLAAGHDGPHESHELPPDTSTNPPSVPPLDVEACVRLLLEEARYPRHRFFCNPRSAWTAGEQLMCDCGANVLADTLRALASALPGMGKDSERLDTLERFGWVKAGWGLVPQFEWTRKADDGPGGWARLVSPRLRDAIDAARAAQPV